MVTDPLNISQNGIHPVQGVNILGRLVQHKYLGNLLGQSHIA